MNALAALLAAALAAAPAAAAEDSSAVLGIESYEPSTFGWTDDSDDDAFLDVKLSFKYPLLADTIKDTQRVYLAATVRFAQYLGSRESSPVIGKRFNPELLWRHWRQDTSRDSYIDLAYGHESNGQSITTPEEFRFEAARQVATGGKPEAAKDHISRGWDYVKVASKHPTSWSGHRFTLYPSLRLFLPNGLLQGEAEEYNDWENDAEGKPRRQVNGLALLAKYTRRLPSDWFTDLKLAAGWETGYSRPFRYNTVRLEAGIKFLQLPLMVFYQDGYNSDLALYYKRVSSAGVALEMGSF